MVRVGLRGNQLAVLDIEDGLGQRSVITFNDWQSGPGLTMPPISVSCRRPGPTVIRP